MSNNIKVKSKGSVKVFCKNCNKEDSVFPSRAKDYTYCSKECMFEYFSKLRPPKIMPKEGERINNWIITSNKTIRKHGRRYIKVKCTCGSGIESELPVSHLESKIHKGCNKCSRSHSYKGFGDLSGEIWAHIKSGALKRDLEFNIPIEYAWSLYLKQDKKCALSGIDIFFSPSCSRKKGVDLRSKRSASLDRIDSQKPYVIGNVQWVHKDVNLMKNKFKEDYFIKICGLIWKKVN